MTPIQHLVAQHLNVPLLKSAAPPAPTPKPKRPHVYVQTLGPQIAELKSQGWPNTTIAAHLGIAVSSVGSAYSRYLRGKS